MVDKLPIAIASALDQVKSSAAAAEPGAATQSQRQVVFRPRRRPRWDIDPAAAVAEFVQHLTTTRPYEMISDDDREMHHHNKNDCCRWCRGWRTPQYVMKVEWERFKNDDRREYNTIQDRQLWELLSEMGMPSDYSYIRMIHKYEQQPGKVKHLQNYIDQQKYVWGIRQSPIPL